MRDYLPAFFIKREEMQGKVELDRFNHLKLEINSLNYFKNNLLVKQDAKYAKKVFLS